MNSKITRLYFILRGKYKHLKIGTHLHKKWYGNRANGFYVAPKLLNQNSVVYSFGVGENISFDKSLIENHGCTVYAFDPTPKSIAWCKKQDLPATFYLNKYGIAPKTGHMKFHLPKNKEFISGSLISNNGVSNENMVDVPMKCFTDISKQLGHQKIDLLKMDIEGSEYDVIDEILNSDVEIKQIAIEFHERFFQNGQQKTCEFIQKMKNNGYHIFGISDIFEEVSFVKL